MTGRKLKMHGCCVREMKKAARRREPVRSDRRRLAVSGYAAMSSADESRYRRNPSILAGWAGGWRRGAQGAPGRSAKGASSHRKGERREACRSCGYRAARPSTLSSNGNWSAVLTFSKPGMVAHVYAENGGSQKVVDLVDGTPTLAAVIKGVSMAAASNMSAGAASTTGSIPAGSASAHVMGGATLDVLSTQALHGMAIVSAFPFADRS